MELLIMRLESEMYQTIPPLFQPLRLWKSKTTPDRNPMGLSPLSTHSKKGSARIFAMRGGYISIAEGERRLIIAGKLFRNLEQI